jgi:hypothetical protein
MFLCLELFIYNDIYHTLNQSETGQAKALTQVNIPIGISQISRSTRGSTPMGIGRFSLTVKQGTLNLRKWPTHNTRKFLNVTIIEYEFSLPNLLSFSKITLL